MIELFWKRMSLLSLRLVWKMSLQMLSRLFPLTHSWRGKENSHIFFRKCPSALRLVDTHAHPQRHRRLTARQSLAMCRLSWAELRSMRRNNARSIPDLLLQRRPSMSAAAKVPWRRSHKSHKRSTEPSELPGKAEIAKRKNIMSTLGQHVKHWQRKQTSRNENTLLCVLASVHPYKYRWTMFYVCCAIYSGSAAYCTFIIWRRKLRLNPQHQ